MAVNESLFPNLRRLGYRITSPPDAEYNCIAWAAGVTTAWWWPDPDQFDYWPPGVVHERTLVAFLQAFDTAGYSPCPDGSLWKQAGKRLPATPRMKVRRMLPDKFPIAAGRASWALTTTSNMHWKVSSDQRTARSCSTCAVLRLDNE